MTLDDTIHFIKKTVNQSLDKNNVKVAIKPSTSLIGGESGLDSMKLVELCIALQDKASELGFEFDWTSENAMSKSRSMFRSVQSLATEFIKQQSKQK